MTHDPGAARPRPSLTPPAFPSPLAQPRVAAAAVIPAPRSVSRPRCPCRRARVAPRRSGGSACSSSCSSCSSGTSSARSARPHRSSGCCWRCCPLAGVLLAVRLVDRWEPEPRGLLVFAVAWGAIVAVGIALGVDLLITTVFGDDDLAGTRGVHRGRAGADRRGVRQGPRRLHHLPRAPDAPSTDPSTGSSTAGSSAPASPSPRTSSTSRSASSRAASADVSTTFFVRGILSPFAHVMFTSVTGFALGLAARRGARRAARPSAHGCSA